MKISRLMLTLLFAYAPCGVVVASDLKQKMAKESDSKQQAAHRQRPSKKTKQPGVIAQKFNELYASEHVNSFATCLYANDVRLSQEQVIVNKRARDIITGYMDPLAYADPKRQADLDKRIVRMNSKYSDTYPDGFVSMGHIFFNPRLYDRVQKQAQAVFENPKASSEARLDAIRAIAGMRANAKRLAHDYRTLPRETAAVKSALLFGTLGLGAYFVKNNASTLVKTGVVTAGTVAGNLYMKQGHEQVVAHFEQAAQNIQTIAVGAGQELLKQCKVKKFTTSLKTCAHRFNAMSPEDQEAFSIQLKNVAEFDRLERSIDIPSGQDTQAEPLSGRKKLRETMKTIKNNRNSHESTEEEPSE